MGYLIGQIFLCLLLAAALGFIIAWLLRGVFGGSSSSSGALAAGAATGAVGGASLTGSGGADASRRVSSLEGELKASQRARDDCRGEVDRLKARISELEKGSGGGSASGGAAAKASDGGASADAGRISSLEGDLKSAQRERDESRGEVGTLKARIAELESAGGATGISSSDARPEALSGPRGGKADDLKKISGVGKHLEKVLNGLGIYHYQQIAELTQDNIDWVNAHLQFKGRIEREDWVKQSKQLATGEATDFSRRYDKGETTSND